MFILDRDSSDIWHLGADARTPTRLTTQRGMEPYWEDTAATVSPDGSQVAFGDGGAVWTIPIEAIRPDRRCTGWTTSRFRCSSRTVSSTARPADEDSRAGT